MALMVKSVEFIEITQSGTETYSTVGLTKGQNYENCIPFLTSHGAGDNMDNHFMDVSFSGTAGDGYINFTRDEHRSTAQNLKCFVVEFDPAEVKVQQGSFSLPSNGTVAFDTPESFTQTKTGMVHYWQSTDGGQRWDRHLVRGRVLSNGTQVDMYRNETGGTISGHYFLFEDISAGNDHFVVDHQTSSYTGTGDQTSMPTGRRDPTRTLMLASYACSDGGSTYNDRQTARFFIYFKGFGRSDRNYAGGTIYSQIQYITFTDESRVYVSHHSALSFGTTDTTLTSSWLDRPCNLTFSTVISTSQHNPARGTATTSAQNDSLWTSLKFNSSTEIQAERNSTGGSNNSYLSYTVVDWSGAVINTGTNSSPLDPDISFVKSTENFRITVEDYYKQRVLTKGQDVSNCALFLSYRGDNTNNNIRSHQITTWLREPGIVVAHRNDASGDGIVDVSVVEFYPDQVKVQQGEFDLWSVATDEVDIDSVDTDKAFMLHSWECNDATRWDRIAIRGRFLTASGIQFYREDAGNLIDGNWFIIEDLADNFEVTHYISSFTSTSVSLWTQTYHNYYSCLPIASYAVSTGAYYTDRSTARVYQKGGGGRAIIDRTTAADTMYGSFQLVRFLDERIHAQPSAPTLDTSTTVVNSAIVSHHSGNEDAFSAYNPMQNSVGRTTGTAADDIRGAFNTFRLINSNTEIETSRDATVGVTCYPSYGGLIDWIGHTHPLADEKHDITTVVGTKSLVRSVEAFPNTTATRITLNYLTKGQRPENCVPFASWRIAADDGETDRLARYYYIDDNSKVTGYGDGAGNGGDLDEMIYVVEFNPDQVKVQKIFATMTGTSFNVDIPQEVDLTKTFMWFGYATDHWANRWDRALITGRFLSSTELNFLRNDSSNGVYLVIYLIECLQDQWEVRRDWNGSEAAANFYDYVNFTTDGGFRVRFIQGSYSATTGAVYADRSTMRLYPRQDHGFQWNRDQNYDSIQYRNLEVMEFNPELDIRVGGYWTDMDGGTSSQTKSLYTDIPLDMDRSIVCPTIVNSINRTAGSSVDDIGGTCHRFELTNSGTEVTCHKYAKGTQTYGWFQWVEWPPYKTHYFEGNVYERGEPVVRQVSCFRADNHELMDYTVSASGTGYYRLETTYDGAHYIICQDDTAGIDYNDLILGKMEPYPITSGTIWGDA